MSLADDCIVLVPGLFGFGAFGAGRGGAPRIDYFAEVKKVLSARTGVPQARIRSTEPPPTGALAHRVAELVTEIEQVLAAAPDGARVHVVGHSTGGVDARLLANPAYHAFTGHGVEDERRRRVAARLGHVVTLSAPFHGTPCAVKLRPEFKGLVAALSLWNVLDHGGALAGALGPLVATLLGALQVVARDGRANAGVVELLDRLGVDHATVGEIVKFRDAILRDDALLDDLAPGRMEAMNARLAPDPIAIESYVTASPRPALGDLGGLERRAFYLLLHHATSDASFAPAAFPHGRWLVGAHDHDLVGNAPEASDGVVPASSQTVSGEAAGIVLADHEDVIGHFDGQENTTLFKSGSGFTRARFARLWADVAARLGR